MKAWGARRSNKNRRGEGSKKRTALPLFSFLSFFLAPGARGEKSTAMLGFLATQAIFQYTYISKMKNGEKAQRNHEAYAAWAFSAKLQKINT